MCFDFREQYADMHCKKKSQSLCTQAQMDEELSVNQDLTIAEHLLKGIRGSAGGHVRFYCL